MNGDVNNEEKTLTSNQEVHEREKRLSQGYNQGYCMAYYSELDPYGFRKPANAPGNMADFDSFTLLRSRAFCCPLQCGKCILHVMHIFLRFLGVDRKQKKKTN